MEKKLVKSKLNDSFIYSEFEYSIKPPWTLKITVANTFDFSCVAADLFEAFVKARKEASKINLYFLCNGARENVYPSPMMKSMAGGAIAYTLTIGQQARRNDTVKVFEETEEEIASVEGQRQFYERWLTSLQ
ncbi:hypothetical protein G8770_08695 [Aestuariicella hydrocarbonica]|uniref:Uncharacterized protein n=1 Tax=Pseudomaricurvus hydrocarbonicus TaxID=1470433 RepID=A0A9E5MH77_9GAMM|nr:hypothetical protein [Aestuariicella hydrocarbonica]NHO65616.1 hypothetical protein [Aestuariicella hydrocarbonica]